MTRKFDFEIVRTNPYEYTSFTKSDAGTCNCKCSTSSTYSAGYSVGNFDANNEV